MKRTGLAAEVDLRQGAERLPCVLLLDTSGSMQIDGRIDHVNAGLAEIKKGLMENNLTRVGVEIAIITFDNEVHVRQHFETADNFEAIQLTAQGQTFLGRAMLEAVDLIKERCSHYGDMGIPYKRPLLFVISDGLPEGEPPQLTEQGSNAVREAVANKKLTVWPLVVGTGIETSQLGQLTGGPAKRLDETKWEEMWKWLSQSLRAVSQSKPGQQVPLPAKDWEYDG